LIHPRGNHRRERKEKERKGGVVESSLFSSPRAGYMFEGGRGERGIPITGEPPSISSRDRLRGKKGRKKKRRI